MDDKIATIESTESHSVEKRGTTSACDGQATSTTAVPKAAPVQYAYLDHTADVQLHAWASTLEEAFQQLVIALYGYMTTDISSVEPIYTMDFEASGHDIQSLIFNLLDTCLYNFCAEPFFIGCIAQVLRLNRPNLETSHNGGVKGEFSIHLRVWGESFDKQKHPAGIEVKAITYSNMQIIEKPEEDDKKENRTNIFVIVDI